VNVNKDFLLFLQTFDISENKELGFRSTKKHINTIYKMIGDIATKETKHHKFWFYYRPERMFRIDLGITKTYKNLSAIKNNILQQAQKEINKSSKYKIYFDYSKSYHNENMIRIKIFESK